MFDFSLALTPGLSPHCNPSTPSCSLPCLALALSSPHTLFQPLPSPPSPRHPMSLLLFPLLSPLLHSYILLSLSKYSFCHCLAPSNSIFALLCPFLHFLSICSSSILFLTLASHNFLSLYPRAHSSTLIARLPPSSCPVYVCIDHFPIFFSTQDSFKCLISLSCSHTGFLPLAIFPVWSSHSVLSPSNHTICLPLPPMLAVHTASVFISLAGSPVLLLISASPWPLSHLPT